MAQTIDIIKVREYYNDFRGNGPQNNAGVGEEAVKLSAGPSSPLTKFDANSDGWLTFSEYLSGKNPRQFLQVKNLLEDIKTLLPTLSGEEQMQLLFKAYQLGEKIPSFIQLCAVYHSANDKLPPEELQSALVRLVKGASEADLTDARNLIAGGKIKNASQLETWLDFAKANLSELPPYQRQVLSLFVSEAQTDNLKPLLELKKQLAGVCKNEHQARYIIAQSAGNIEELLQVLKAKSLIIKQINNAGQAEFLARIKEWEFGEGEENKEKLDKEYREAVFKLARLISSPEVGGLMGSLLADQFYNTETAELVAYFTPLIPELEGKVALAAASAVDAKASGAISYSEKALNEKEKGILAELEASWQNKKSAEALLAIVRKYREAPVPKEVAYSGQEKVLASQVSWNEVFGVFFGKQDNAREKIVEYLALKLKESSREGREAEFKQLLKSIPCRDVLDALLKDESLDLSQKLPELWQEARPLFGEISHAGDKIDYAKSLQEALAAQGIPWNTGTTQQAFRVPLTFINLNNMSRITTSGMVIPLEKGNKYVILAKNPKNGTWEGRILNASGSTNLLKSFWRSTIFPDKPGEPSQSYFMAYYPKVHLDQGKMKINMEYESPEAVYEHFGGRITAGDRAGYDKALSKFTQAYESEDAFMAEQMSLLKANLSEATLKKAREEEIPDFDKLFTLILDMDDRGGEEEIKRVFGVSEGEYEGFRNDIESVLLDLEEKAKKGEKITPLSPAAFMAKAIEKCGGRALLATAISYELLWNRSGRASGGNLTTVYPNAFDWKGINAEDKSGAVYHFMGTFFSAYGVQTSLVRRYHTDKGFRAQVEKQKDKLLADFKKAKNVDFKDQDDQKKLLMLTQYIMLDDGNENQREALTLAGIFKEEVMEDQDASNEIFHDVRGMAAGHGFYEMVWGASLTKKGEWSSLNDNRRNAFVELLSNAASPKDISFSSMLKVGGLIFGRHSLSLKGLLS